MSPPQGNAGDSLAADPRFGAASGPRTLEPPWWRGAAATAGVALLILIAAIAVTDQAGFTIRDPDQVAIGYFFMVGFAVLLLVGLDIAIRAGRIEGTWRPSRAAMSQVRRERWNRRRGISVAIAVASFYTAYFAYRNLKASVPLLRPELFDADLLDLERTIFGNDPAQILHSILGTGISAHILSWLYASFIVFLPLSLALFLVFSPKLQMGMFFVTAQCINWALGAASYFLIPSLGPVYAAPNMFTHLAPTEADRLQDMLWDDRVSFLSHIDYGPLQAIAAFASLHIAMSFTVALAAQMLGLNRKLRIALWTWLVVMFIGTIYLGWHYVIDDVAGIAMGAIALFAASALTGFDLRAERRSKPQSETA
jgi:membrane-associated phospholipid phosphatase